jgi:FkbM family methyltransferase
MNTGDFEADERDAFIAMMSWADVFINVGANTGYWVCQGLFLGRRTIAFEPDPRNIKFLMRNLISNGWEQGVEVYPCVATSEVGVTRLYGAGTGASLIANWAGQQKSTYVPATTLDCVLTGRLIGRRVFMLIDVEGSELDCLQGGGHFVDEVRDVVLCLEINSTAHHPNGFNPSAQKTLELLLSWGFKPYEVALPLVPIAVEELRGWITSGTALSSHNFLFIRDSSAMHSHVESYE